MFEKEWFPKANSIGISWDEFWKMNPRIIKLHQLGHKETVLMRDEEMWRLGLYIRESLKSTVCNSFVWKGKGQLPDEYPKQPFLQSKEHHEITEQEKRLEVERFFAQESARRANWKRTHKK